MNYRLALRELMDLNGYTIAWLSRAMNASPMMVRNIMQPVRNVNGQRVDNGMTMSTFMRIAKAMNCRVILEWRDPRNMTKYRRWRIDNSDYFGVQEDGRALFFDDKEKSEE